MSRTPRVTAHRAAATVVGAWIGGLAIVLSTFAGAAIAPASAAAAPVAQSAASAVPAANLASFDPGNIIGDSVFFYKDAMSQAQIQAFLVAKVPTCQSGYTCLKDWYDTSRTIPADAMCKAYSGGVRERASRIIYKVAQACGINPQVILVTLQKEQGLVTHTWPSDWRYTAAMGQGCPDTAACDERYNGFFNQVYGAAWQFKRYANPPGTSQYFTWYAPGKTWNILYNPDRSCGTSAVRIANQATANLYYYTPYQPNKAALAAGYGTGNSCSSYGNRNFYNYFTDWFGSTQKVYATVGCAQPLYPTAAKYAYVVTKATLPARSGPNAKCDDDRVDLASGTVVRAVAVYGDWLEINTESGTRWVNRDYLRRASTAEAACTLPGQTGPAKLAYVLTADVASRIVPSSGCASGAKPLPAGTILQAVSVVGDWLKIELEDGLRWIPRDQTRKATAAETSCALPGGVGTAVKRYVVDADAASLRSAPDAGCAIGLDAIERGTMVQATGVVDGWLKIQVGDREQWIDRDQVRYATAAELACLEPVAPGAAKLRYVVSADGATGRLAPNTACAKGAVALAEGTAVQATAVSEDWLRVQYGDAEVWVPRAAVIKESAVCTIPSGVSAAKLTYLVKAAATGRSAPSSACATKAKSLPAHAVVKATGVWKTWLRVTSGSSSVWVLRSEVQKVVAKHTTASVNLRSGPSSTASVVTVLQKGAAVVVTGTSGQWSSVVAGTRTGWVSTSYLG